MQKVPKIISDSQSGMRLSRWFLYTFPKLTIRDFYKFCRTGEIRLNSKRCKGKELLNKGDMIRIPPFIDDGNIQKNNSGDDFNLSDLENLRKCIIYDDDDIVVFNKPAGIPVQGGSGIKKSIDKMAIKLYPYNKVSLVHRLDKETSGILIVAKNQNASVFLSKEFQNKNIKKNYLAVLDGNIFNKSGIIDNYIEKKDIFDKENKNHKSQRAITKYKLLSEIPNLLSVVLFSPLTGRTHQLRIHSALSLNAPIIGDNIYGKKNPKLKGLIKSNKLFLCAYKITFRHPSLKKFITLKAHLPSFFQELNKFIEIKMPE